MQQEKIQFRKVRNMGETIAATTAFVRQNGNILFKSILFVALPFLLFAVGGYIMLFSWLFFGSGSFDTALDNFDAYTGLSSVFSLLAMMGSVVLIAVVHEFMFLYIRRNDVENITVKDVRQKVIDHFGLYAGTTVMLALLLFFILLLVFVFLFFVVVSVIYISEESVSLYLIMMLGLSLLATYPFVAVSFIYMVRAVEGKSFASAIRRCFDIIGGSWLSTLWLYIVTVLITLSVIGLVPILVTGGIAFVIYFFSWEDIGVFLLSFAYILYLIMGIVVNVIALIVVAFRYFSLVEKKEAIGLMRRVALVGATTTDEL